MLFWILCGALVAVVALAFGLSLFRAGGAGGSAAEYDLKVYRDQLAEVDRDLARGVIGAEDAERLRTEIARRILEADRTARGEAGAAAQPRGLSLGAAALMALVLAGSVWVYARVGAPGYPDLPIAGRIAAAEERRASREPQEVAEASAAERLPAPPEADPRWLDLMEKLRAAVAQRPNDVEGLALLARNEAALGNYGAAKDAQRRLVALKGEAATAEDFAALADVMILAAGGEVSPEAEAVLTEALVRDPQNGIARYYSGLMLAQTGRPDLAFRLWRSLLESSPPGAPWVGPIRAQIEALAQDAGVNYTLPAALTGPSAADIEAAGEMTPEQRETMIRGMVEGLGERLATEGGTAEDWARMIGALGVLGERDRAAAIWAEAQGIFAARPEDLARVRAAAEAAGVAE